MCRAVQLMTQGFVGDTEPRKQQQKSEEWGSHNSSILGLSRTQGEGWFLVQQLDKVVIPSKCDPVQSTKDIPSYGLQRRRERCLEVLPMTLSKGLLVTIYLSFRIFLGEPSPDSTSQEQARQPSHGAYLMLCFFHLSTFSSYVITCKSIVFMIT